MSSRLARRPVVDSRHASRTRDRLMPREATGEILTRERKDGQTTFIMRVRALGERRKIILGTDAEGWNLQRAENHLAVTMDRIRRGVFTWPEEVRNTRTDDPSFHEFASGWYERKRRGVDDDTRDDYEWRLSNHLLPFFKSYRLSEIDIDAVERYIAAKLTERDELREAGKRALSNDSINATVALLAQILDAAAERKLQVAQPNPARGKNRRLKSQRAHRTFLEPDQARALLDAAGEIDAERQLTWEQAREIRCSRESNLKLASRYGVSDSLVSRIKRGKAWRHPEPRARTIIATLLLGGMRIEEFCSADVGDFDRVNRSLRISDAKTPTGRRLVSLSDMLASELEQHVERLGPRKPKDPLFCNSRGQRYTPSGVRDLLDKSVERARVKLAKVGGVMPDPVTPHTLRRTFISLLLAGGADVPFVMAQVGHKDSKVTLEIYAQVVQGRQRDHGRRVDEMIGGATPFGSTNGSTDDDGEELDNPPQGR